MVDLFTTLEHLLQDRYRLDREIGAGRLATVFLAQDLRHARPVAIKALRPDLGRDEVARRFLREIEIAAGLTHPNIVPVFDSGERSGIPFFVMPFEEGGSLRQRLEREGRLPVRDAVRLAHDILEALRCAHSHGIIHLDVKPENVLLSPDHGLLADFGVARACAGDPHRIRDRPLGVVGTPTYMSPEQTSGEEEQDPRSDLYSVGCVLYEMLAGEPPFKAATSQGVMAKHLSEVPPALSLTRPTAPESLGAAVRKALQKQAADRFPDAEAFLRVLRETPLERDGTGVAASSSEVTRFSGGGRRGTAGGSIPSITVWIVEDHPDYREDLEKVIGKEDDLTCPCTFSSAEEMLQALRDHWAPDVVLMDISLSGKMDGIDATARIKRSWPGTEVVMLTIHDDHERIFRAFAAGAISYLAKTETDEEILRAVRAAPRGGSVMTPQVARRFLRMFQQVSGLSGVYQFPQEDAELLADLEAGKTTEDIARERALDQDSLDVRLRLIHAKHHVNSDSQLPISHGVTGGSPVAS